MNNRNPLDLVLFGTFPNAQFFYSQLFLLISLFIKVPHNKSLLISNFQSLFLALSFPPTNSLPCFCPWNIRLSWSQIQKQQVWLYLDVATMPMVGGESSLGRDAALEVGQGEATISAFWCKCEGHKGGSCQEAWERLCEKLVFPNPQSREKRAHALPEWKQRVRDRKRIPPMC